MTAMENELVLDRLLDAPREKLFRCWSDAKLLRQWFAPAPYTIPVAELDFRVGGASNVVMRSPEGQDMPISQTYLEIIPNRKIVLTDAYVGDWVPSGKPFMTAIVTFDDEGGKTRYIARARHWNKDDYDAHVKMGFHEGWGQVSNQLEALAKSL